MGVGNSRELVLLEFWKLGKGPRIWSMNSLEVLFESHLNLATSGYAMLQNRLHVRRLAPAADCQFPGCSSWTGAGCSQLEQAGCYWLTAEQMRKRPSNCQKPKDSKIAWLPPNLFPIWNPSHFQGKHLQWEQNSLAQECSTLKTDEINYQFLSISFEVKHPSEQFSKHRYLLKVS